jgi:hypothetical protein
MLETGKVKLYQNLTWSPAKYTKDLSLKLSPNMRNFIEIGMSKKNGT